MCNFSVQIPNEAFVLSPNLFPNFFPLEKSFFIWLDCFFLFVCFAHPLFYLDIPEVTTMQAIALDTDGGDREGINLIQLWGPGNSGGVEK